MELWYLNASCVWDNDHVSDMTFWDEISYCLGLLQHSGVIISISISRDPEFQLKTIVLCVEGNLNQNLASERLNQSTWTAAKNIKYK